VMGPVAAMDTDVGFACCAATAEAARTTALATLITRVMSIPSLAPAGTDRPNSVGAE